MAVVRVHPRYRRLVVAGIIQTIVLAATWIFSIVIKAKNPLTLPDSAAVWVHNNPKKTNMVVGSVATCLNIVSNLICFTTAVLEVLRQLMTREDVSLIKLSAMVAISRTSVIMNWRKQHHIHFSLCTLAIHGAFAFLTTELSTLFLPVVVFKQVDVYGSELDIGSASFDAALQQASDANMTSFDWFELLADNSLMSGISVAEANVNLGSMIDFNGATYISSTGGILPAVISYNGTQQPGQNNSGFTFSGGPVPANITSNPSTGISTDFTTYNIIQQGLSAQVTCWDYNEYTVTHTGFTLQQNSTSLGNGWMDTTVIANCDGNRGSSNQSFLTLDLFQSNPADIPTGLLSSVVCPDVFSDDIFNYTVDRIVIASNGTGLYNFLPPTVCEVVPIITKSEVTYDSRIIFATIVDNVTLSSDQQNLIRFLMLSISYQINSAQSIQSNIIGNSLRSVYTSTDTLNGTSRYLEELEGFWQGVVEFSGTYLRSAFSAHPDAIPPDHLISMEGQQIIETMGWSAAESSFFYTLIPVTLTSCLTYFAIYLSFHYARKNVRDGVDSESDLNSFDNSGDLWTSYEDSTVRLRTRQTARGVHPYFQWTRGQNDQDTSTVSRPNLDGVPYALLDATTTVTDTQLS